MPVALTIILLSFEDPEVREHFYKGVVTPVNVE